MAAARRAVQSEHDRFALFPELVTHKTVEERLSAVEIHRRESLAEFRQHKAECWRRVRSEMARLPAVSREGVFRYWQRCRCPGDPVYLAGMVRQCRAGVSFWGKLAELRRFELIRLGRLPNPFLEREKRA